MEKEYASALDYYDLALENHYYDHAYDYGAPYYSVADLLLDSFHYGYIGQS